MPTQDVLGATSGPSWARLLGELLEDIKSDILEMFGVDVDREEVSWHWFAAKLATLLSAPAQAYRPDGYPLPRTRLQAALNPPPRPKKT